MGERLVMKICLTGYKGFIGSHLGMQLAKEGHEVIGFRWKNPNHFPDPSLYDWVIHLGAITSTTERNVDKILKTNLEYSMKLLEMCDTMGTNFQYASSASVYGNTGNFKEDGDVYPLNAYAWSKYLFDRFVNSIMGEFKVLVQGFRYFNVYGNNEESKGDQASPVTKFANQAKTGKIKLFENSDQYLRDFVCVDDVCEVHSKMMNKDVSGIFNVGTGAPISFQKVAELVAKKYNAEIEIIPMPAKLQGQYQTYTSADLTELNKNIEHKFKTVEEFLNAN